MTTEEPARSPAARRAAVSPSGYVVRGPRSRSSASVPALEGERVSVGGASVDGRLFRVTSDEQGATPAECRVRTAKLKVAITLAALATAIVSLLLLRVALSSSPLAAAAVVTLQSLSHAIGYVLVVYVFHISLPGLLQTRWFKWLLLSANVAEVLLSAVVAAVGPAAPTDWLQPSKTSVVFKLLQSLRWLLYAACYYVIIPLCYRKWRASRFAHRSDGRSMMGLLATTFIAFSTLMLVLRYSVGFNLTWLGFAFLPLLVLVLHSDRGRALRHHSSYQLAVAFSQFGVTIIPGLMLTVMQAAGDDLLARLLVVTGYVIAYATLLLLLRTVADAATTPVFALPLTIIVDAFDALFFNLVYLLAVPFSAPYMSVWLVDSARAVLANSGLLQNADSLPWLRRLLRRLGLRAHTGRAASITLAVRDMQEALLAVDQQFMVRRMGGLLVPIVLVLDQLLPFGQATVSYGMQLQLSSVLAGYAFLLVSQELCMRLGFWMLQRTLTEKAARITAQHAVDAHADRMTSRSSKLTRTSSGAVKRHSQTHFRSLRHLMGIGRVDSSGGASVTPTSTAVVSPISHAASREGEDSDSASTADAAVTPVTFLTHGVEGEDDEEDDSSTAFVEAGAVVSFTVKPVLGAHAAAAEDGDDEEQADDERGGEEQPAAGEEGQAEEGSAAVSTVAPRLSSPLKSKWKTVRETIISGEASPDSSPFKKKSSGSLAGSSRHDWTQMALAMERKQTIQLLDRREQLLMNYWEQHWLYFASACSFCVTVSLVGVSTLRHGLSL